MIGYCDSRRMTPFNSLCLEKVCQGRQFSVVIDVIAVFLLLLCSPCSPLAGRVIVVFTLFLDVCGF